MAYPKTTWLDKLVQFPKRYYMNSDGGNDKNLLPPFTDWTLHANAAVDSTNPYKVALTATATFQYSDTPVVQVTPSQSYYMSHDYTMAANSYLEVYQSDLPTTGFSLLIGAWSNTGKLITPTKPYIKIRFGNSASSGSYTLVNPQLEQAVSATAFTPKKMYTITQSGGTVTAAGTPVNAANLNRMENALESIIGKDNTTVAEVTAVHLETDTRTTQLTFSSGVLTKVEEKNGGTVIKTTVLNYSSGVLTSTVETANGRTVTSNLNYVSGVLDNVTKVVT